MKRNFSSANRDTLKYKASYDAQIKPCYKYKRGKSNTQKSE